MRHKCAKSACNVGSLISKHLQGQFRPRVSNVTFFFSLKSSLKEAMYSKANDALLAHLCRKSYLRTFWRIYVVSDSFLQNYNYFIFYTTIIILERGTAKPLPPWLHLYCSGFPRLPFTSFTEAYKAALFELFNIFHKTLILEVYKNTFVFALNFSIQASLQSLFQFH